MAARYILAVLAITFLVAALIRRSRGGMSQAQARTWLLIALIFGTVSAWLFSRS
jgi:hypothetical protein